MNIIVKMAYASKEVKIGQFEIVTYLSPYEAIMGCAIYERWSDRSRVRKKPDRDSPKKFIHNLWDSYLCLISL